MRGKSESLGNIKVCGFVNGALNVQYDTTNDLIKNDLDKSKTARNLVSGIQTHFDDKETLEVYSAKRVYCSMLVLNREKDIQYRSTEVRCVVGLYYV